MPLTACLLARDDESRIGDAIRSVAGVAEQVVVMDTGSRDDTPKVAVDAGAEVHAIAWDDDFSAGRNAAIAQARGDWVLWLNPDERWVEPARDALEALMAADVPLGYAVRVRSGDGASTAEVPGETWDLRLFRNLPGLKFEGRLHPGLNLSSLGGADLAERPVRESPILLRSVGEGGPRDPAKLRWMLRLLDRELADRPGQLRYMIERARVLEAMGDPTADACHADVLRGILAAADQPAPPTGKVALILEAQIAGRSPKGVATIDRAAAVALALRWFPHSPPLLWALAGSHFERLEFAEAAAVLARLVDLGEQKAFDRSRPFPPEIVGDQALMNLGACHAKIGNLADARSCFAKLLMSPAYAEDAARNLRLVGG